MNSYFGLARQATASHHDRTEIANAARWRGHCVKADFTKAYQERRRKAKEAMRRRGEDCDILAERERLIRFWKECAEDNAAYRPFDGAWWSTFLRGKPWRSLLMPKLRRLIDEQEKARKARLAAEMQESIERMRQRKAEKLAAKARQASPQRELPQ